MYWTEYSYDAIGRTVAIDHPHTSNDTTISYTRDTSVTGALLKVVTTNPKGQTKTEYKSPLGKLVKVVDAIGGSITYGYDAAGNLVSTNANGEITTISYDNLGRKTAVSGSVRVTACIEDQDIIDRILAHLYEKAQAIPTPPLLIPPPRAPPETLPLFARSESTATALNQHGRH